MASQFAEKIYQVIRLIPKGQVMSYKQVAEEAGYPKAYRAVGTVLSKNHDPSIPCHRVIRSDGKVGQYNRGSERKKAILRHENVDLAS